MSLESVLLTTLHEDIQELTSLLEQAKRERVKGILAAEIRKVESAIGREKERLSSQAVNNAKNEGGGGDKASKTGAYDVQIKNYSWDQSDKFVKVYVTGLNGVQSLPDDSVKSDLTSNSVNVRVEGLSGKNHCLKIKETAEKILPDKSYVKVKTDMVTVFLAKSSPGQKWEHLRAVEKAAAREKAEVPKYNDNDDPSAGIMNMMKQMYNDGDDEMKRTIAKAWTESREKDKVPDAGMF